VEEFYTKVLNFYSKRNKKAFLFLMRPVTEQRKRGNPTPPLEGMNGNGKTFPK
jgi:hypothetical protein